MPLHEMFDDLKPQLSSQSTVSKIH